MNRDRSGFTQPDRCSVQERRRSICILLAGTSGTGKSTLAGLLASRLGITTLVSTDSVRLVPIMLTPHTAQALSSACDWLPAGLQSGAAHTGQHITNVWPVFLAGDTRARYAC